MLQKGFIEKTPDSNGRRIYKIVATQKGKALTDIIAPHDLELKKIITNGLTQEEIEITKRTLNKIKANIIDKVKLQI